MGRTKSAGITGGLPTGKSIEATRVTGVVLGTEWVERPKDSFR